MPRVVFLRFSDHGVLGSYKAIKAKTYDLPVLLRFLMRKNTRSSCFWERMQRYFGGSLSTGVSSRPDGGTTRILA